jgi:hypothetical protein
MKNVSALIALLAVLFISTAVVSAQELIAVNSSDLTGIPLPAGAHRISPESVPAELTATLDKIVAAGEGKFRKGDTEVLVWSGANYSKANAQKTVNRLTATLKAAGWQYSDESAEGDLTIFSAVKEGARRRALVGFHGATDDALIFTWMEILPNGGGADDQTDSFSDNSVKTPRQNTRGGGIVGTWTNGTVSMLNEKNLATGQITSRGGSTFKYVFRANGTFEFIGLINSTMYGCTTSLFNDKRGRYEINGSTITLIPSKNYWRNQYSCSPSSNKERNYVLERETYQYRLKTDEYGATLICLANDKGESCYRREE